MGETRRKFDQDSKEGAVRLVRETGRPVAQVARHLGIKHEDGALPPRAERHERLRAEVRRLFAAHGGKYGSPRITADLRDEGWAVSKNTVAAVMREQGLAARRKKRDSPSPTSSRPPARADDGSTTGSTNSPQPGTSSRPRGHWRIAPRRGQP